ncbi:RNase P and RNase MRP subunit [Marasmius tenuissimus]|uniref:RNase P and RNase MRP subunit n=1 Tax=Marasmius tenuissimus TaxID=585030 RepID=A0ABR3A4I5_9AGAR
MSTTAKVHTQQSNRARPAISEKKVVFKPVLDNPFRVYWPSIPVNLQNLILAHTVTLLDGVSEYHRSRNLANRKRKRAKNENEKPKKKAKKDGMSVDQVDQVDVEAGPAQMEQDTFQDLQTQTQPLDQPPVLSHVTKHNLDNNVGIPTISSSTSAPETDPPPLPSPIRVVLVCRADVNPPILIDHIPHIVAGYNSSLPSGGEDKAILLIPLPAGAEHTLADAFNLRRVAVVGLDAGTPNLESLIKEGIPIVTAPWLAPPPPHQQKRIIPTHIKQLRTTAPKDMKVAKEERAVGRKAAKERKKQKKFKEQIA